MVFAYRYIVVHSLRVNPTAPCFEQWSRVIKYEKYAKFNFKNGWIKPPHDKNHPDIYIHLLVQRMNA